MGDVNHFGHGCSKGGDAMGCFPHSSRLPALQRDVDRAPPIERDKTTADSVRLDSMREIAANKICALVSRSEIRDLVDLRALLEAGVDLKCAGEDTLMKDAGADPATHR